MASKTLLFLLGLTIFAVAYGAWLEEETALDTDDLLTYEELAEHFETEKRGSRKIGRKFLMAWFNLKRLI